MLIHSCLFGFHFMTGRLSASDTLPVLPHPIKAVINIRSARTPQNNFFIFICKSILFHMPLLKKLPAPPSCIPEQMAESQYKYSDYDFTLNTSFTLPLHLAVFCSVPRLDFMQVTENLHQVNLITIHPLMLDIVIIHYHPLMFSFCLWSKLVNLCPKN